MDMSSDPISWTPAAVKMVQRRPRVSPRKVHVIAPKMPNSV